MMEGVSQQKSSIIYQEVSLAWDGEWFMFYSLH